MRVLVGLEQRFVRTPDDIVHSPGGCGPAFWGRYLEVFDEVVVLARVARQKDVTSEFEVASCPGVTFLDLPCWIGPWQYALKYWEARRIMASAVGTAEAMILRVPGPIGSELVKFARKAGISYGLEVVGDPWDVFGTAGPYSSVLRPVLRHLFTYRLRRECQHATAVSYVTRQTLQRRYPARAGVFTTHYSSVELDQAAFSDRSRTYPEPATRLVTIGTLAVDYKGFDILLAALAMFSPDRRPHLTIVGAGRLLSRYQQMVAELQVDQHVTFTGKVPAGEAVREQLDRADLFVLPSRTEGLPRAMIEAMARGLPCIGTSVGGIPELLEPDELVAPGDSRALYRRLDSATSSTEWLERASARNLDKAQEYAAPQLAARRRLLYQELRSAASCSGRRTVASSTFRWRRGRPIR